MPPPANGQASKTPDSSAAKEFQLYYFSELFKRRICAGKIINRVGKVTDLVFKIVEPYPEAVGILVDHGWGRPNEFIPWERVSKVEEDAIFILPTDGGAPFPPFVDQPGWILVNEHLMGKTIFDMDGRRIEVVNDVHLLASVGRMLIVHVDISFNGFLRKWGLGKLTWIKDQLISWRYVQPLSLEDTGTIGQVTLSIARKQIKELPGEDLADALEELSGKEQEAVFSALDSEKAAEVLVEAEPRAQRQLIANLRKERARTILSEMSVPQLAALFSVLPYDDMMAMMELLPKENADRIRSIIDQEELPARALMSSEYLSLPKEKKVGEVMKELRAADRDPKSISYIYIVNNEQVLIGVADLRDLMLAKDDLTLGDIMVSPVVSVQEDDVREDISAMFGKYHFRMIPVVDLKDRICGVIHDKDAIKVD